MYALTVSAEDDCYLCVPPNPGIEAAALGASESALPGTAPVEALHAFTLDSGASRCFFRDSTTVTPIPAPVAVRLADPSRAPILAHSSAILPCPAVPSGSLSGLHLPSFSTNLVSTAALQDAMVTTTTPGGQRVSICTCTQTGRHLATFTHRPASSLYTLTTEPPQVAASGQVSALGPVAAPCPFHLLSHKTLLLHHRLGHPSLPCVRGMHSCLLVFGLPRSLPPLPPSPTPPCIPCVEGRQRAAPHSSFPPTLAPLQTLHMDMWGPAHIRGQGRERYFLLVVDEYSRYTMVFPLRSKGEVLDALIPWILAVRLQLREQFCQDLPILRLHSDRGAQPLAPCLLAGDLAYTALDGGGWRCVGVLGMGLSCLGPRYLRRQALLPRHSLCLPWLSPDAPGWQFYHPTTCRVLPSQDVTFDESVPFCRLFPYHAAPLPLPSLFLTPRPPPVDPLPPQGPAPSGVSQVDPLSLAAPVEVAVDSGAAGGGATRGAASGGAEPERAEPGGAEPGVAESEGAEPGGAEPEGAEPGGTESGGAEHGGHVSAGGPTGASSQREPLSPLQLREWFARRTRLRSGTAGDGGPAAGGTGVGGTGVGGIGAAGPGGTGAAGAGCAACVGARDPRAGGAGAGGTRGAGAAGPGGAHSRGTGAASAGGVAGTQGAGGAGGAGGARAAGSGGVGATGPGGARTRGTGAAGAGGAVGAGVGDPRAGGAGAGDPGARGTGHGGAGAIGTGAGGTVRPRPFFFPLLCQTDSLTERRAPESRPSLPVCAVRTGRRVPCPRPPPVPSTHGMALRPSSVPLRVPLPSPLATSLPNVPDPESDLVRAASSTVTGLLATIITDPSFESAAASALVAELVDFVAGCRPDYAASIVAESEPDCPPSVGGECALGTDVLEDKQADFECLAAAVLQRFGFRYSSPLSTPLPTGHLLSAPPLEESVELSGPYPELVGCLIYLMTCNQPDLAYPLSIMAGYVALGRHRPQHWEAAKRVLRYVCSTSGMGLVLGGRGPVVLSGHADDYWVDDMATQRSSQGYTFSLGSGSVSWRSTYSSFVLSSSCEAEIYAGAMAG
ncbi:unnamed protein product [Closterium sp. NIES-54]